jgi:hypothetical protein
LHGARFAAPSRIDGPLGQWGERRAVRDLDRHWQTLAIVEIDVCRLR